MLYVGVDYHKRYSQVNAIDEKGNRRINIWLPNDFVSGLSGSGLSIDFFFSPI